MEAQDGQLKPWTSRLESGPPMAPPYKDSGKTTRHPGIRSLGEDRFHVRRTWVDPRTGRTIERQATVIGTLEDALRKWADLRGAEPNTSAPRRPRLRDFAREWLDDHRAQIEESTYDRYNNDLANINARFGDWWVDALDHKALRKWQADMSAMYANATVNGWHRTLRVLLDDALRGQRPLLRVNPARELSTLPEGRTKGPRGTALSTDEFKSFVAAIPACVEKKLITPQQGREVTVFAWSAMRAGEVAALRWSDHVEGELHIERSVSRKGKEKCTKTDDPRRFTVCEPLRAALDEQRRWLLETQHPGLSSGLVFPSSPKQAKAGAKRRGATVRWYRSQTTFLESVRAVAKEAKVPQITSHSLRRTFEDLSRLAGVRSLVRRATQGWRSKRAQGIYTTVSREERDAAADAVVRLVMG